MSTKSIAVLLGTLILSGCSSMSPTDKGVLGGGAIGAGTGAIVGKALGNTGAGAVIGAAVGGLSGGLVGNEIEQAEARSDAKLAAATAAPTPGPLGITDVAQLAQAHISDSVIITQIRSSGSVFHLSSNDIVWLKQNGVSDAVVQEMIATANRAPRRVYSATPVYPPVYVVEPAPVVGVGVGYSRGCRW